MAGKANRAETKTASDPARRAHLPRRTKEELEEAHRKLQSEGDTHVPFFRQKFTGEENFADILDNKDLHSSPPKNARQKVEILGLKLPGNLSFYTDGEQIYIDFEDGTTVKHGDMSEKELKIAIERAIVALAEHFARHSMSESDFDAKIAEAKRQLFPKSSANAAFEQARAQPKPTWKANKEVEFTPSVKWKDRKPGQFESPADFISTIYSDLHSSPWLTKAKLLQLDRDLYHALNAHMKKYGKVPGFDLLTRSEVLDQKIGGWDQPMLTEAARVANAKRMRQKPKI